MSSMRMAPVEYPLVTDSDYGVGTRLQPCPHCRDHWYVEFVERENVQYVHEWHVEACPSMLPRDGEG